MACSYNPEKQEGVEEVKDCVVPFLETELAMINSVIPTEIVHFMSNLLQQSTTSQYGQMGETVESKLSNVKAMARTIAMEREPRVVLMKIQAIYSTKMSKRENLILMEQKLVKDEVEKMMIQFCDLTEEKAENMHKIYQLIAEMALVRCLMTGPEGLNTLMQEYHDCVLALVPANPSLQDLMNTDKTLRKAVLEKLLKTMTGIRVFDRNREEVTPIQDLPGILQKAIYILDAVLKEELVCIENKLPLMCEAVIQEFETQKGAKNYEFNQKMQLAKYWVSVLQQLKIYYLEMLREVPLMFEACDRLYRSLALVETKLKHLIGNANFISNVNGNLTHPLFVRLSEIWCSFREELTAVAAVNDVFKKLQALEKKIETVSETDLLQMVGAAPVWNKYGRVTNVPIDSMCTLIPQAEVDEKNLKPEFAGFCPLTLATVKGLVVQGNKSLGMIKYKDRHYHLKDELAMSQFMFRPERYIRLVRTFALQSPELIHLLKLEDEFNIPPSPLMSFERTIWLRNVGSQTERNFKSEPVTASDDAWQLHCRDERLRKVGLSVNACAQSRVTTGLHDKSTQATLPVSTEMQTMSDKEVDGNPTPKPAMPKGSLLSQSFTNLYLE